MAKIKGPAFCPNCGFEGTPKKMTPGSIGVEIVLWLFLIVPGLIYSVWRVSNKKNVCPNCGNENLMPLSAKQGYLNLHQKNT